MQSEGHLMMEFSCGGQSLNLASAYSYGGQTKSVVPPEVPEFLLAFMSSPDIRENLWHERRKPGLYRERERKTETKTYLRRNRRNSENIKE